MPLEQPVLAGRPDQPVNISKAVNGFIVQVGCKVWVSLDWQSVSDALSLYFSDPEAARAAYLPKEG